MNLRLDRSLPLAQSWDWLFHQRVKGGWYLRKDDFEVFMTEKEAGSSAQPGQTVRAFVFRDSEGRLTARRRAAHLSQGEIGFLPVVKVSDIGAFLDWGLPKHLFLPKTQWQQRPRRSDKVLVRLLLDDENRPTATQRIWESLEAPSAELKRGISLRFIPLKNAHHGILGALDSTWRGFFHLPSANLPIGKPITAYFLGSDHQQRGRISFLPPGALGMKYVADRLKQLAQANQGILPLNETSDPLTVWSQLQLTKNEFKRILGELLQTSQLVPTPKGLVFKTE